MIGRNALHGEGIAARSHCGRGCMCIFVVSAVCTKQVSWASVIAGVSHSTGVFDIIVYICDTITAGCANALVCSQFDHSRWRTRLGGSTSLCRALVTWRGGLFLTEGVIGVLSCVFLFLTRVGVYVGVYACIFTHTHILHIECSM